MILKEQVIAMKVKWKVTVLAHEEQFGLQAEEYSYYTTSGSDASGLEYTLQSFYDNAGIEVVITVENA